MSDTTGREDLNDQQQKYVRFLARGKRDIAGKAYTNQEFADLIKVNQNTLYEWKRKPAFREALMEASIAELSDTLPALNQAMIAKALGNPVKEKRNAPDVPAYLAIMRQFELLKSDKIDHTTNGKDMPAPIVSLDALRGNTDQT